MSNQPTAVTTEAKSRAESDLASAAAVHESVNRPRVAGTPVDFLEFASSLSFLVTVGYLTKEQAQALLQWFESTGTMALPPLPGGETAGPLTAYQLLSTAIKILTPPESDDESIFSFFADAVAAVGDLIATTLDGISTVLHEGTGLLEAGAHFLRAADHLL